MPRRSLTTEQVLTLLAATPPRIAALAPGLASAQLHIAPTHDERPHLNQIERIVNTMHV